MTRTRIDRLKIRVRAPLDAAGARELAAAVARALPSAMARPRDAQATERVSVPAVRIGKGELAQADRPALAGRVAQAIGRAITGEEPR